jgi:hypothetical protein
VEHKGLYVQEREFVYLSRVLARACVYDENASGGVHRTYKENTLETLRIDEIGIRSQKVCAVLRDACVRTRPRVWELRWNDIRQAAKSEYRSIVETFV